MTVRMQKNKVYNTSQEIIELQKAFEIWSNLTSILHGPKNIQAERERQGERWMLAKLSRASFFEILARFIRTHQK